LLELHLATVGAVSSADWMSDVKRELQQLL